MKKNQADMNRSDSWDDRQVAGMRGKSGLVTVSFFIMQLVVIVALISPWQGVRLKAFVGDEKVQVASSQELVTKTMSTFPQYFTVHIRDVDLQRDVDSLHVYLLAFEGSYASLDMVEKADAFFDRNIFEHAFAKMNWYQSIDHDKYNFPVIEEDILRVEAKKVYYEDEKLVSYMEEILHKYPDKVSVKSLQEIVSETKLFLDTGVMQEITIDVKNK